MACRDGVAVLAAHSSDKDSEPLLFYETEKGKPNDNDDGDDKSPYLDLPSWYAGPFRIHPVGGAAGGGGTTIALIACGWRADGSGRLLDEARDLAAEEAKYFGQDIDSFLLASQLSVFLAENVVEGVSCLVRR